MMMMVPASLKALTLVTVSSWGSILAKAGGRATFVGCLLCVRHVHISSFTRFSEPPCMMDTHIPFLQREKLGLREALATCSRSHRRTRSVDFSPYHSHLPGVIIRGFLPRLRDCRMDTREMGSGLLRKPCPEFSPLFFLNPDMDGSLFSKSPHPNLF